MEKSFEEKALKMLEDFNTRTLLNTKEKQERYSKAIKHRYSSEFALIFALQGN